MDAFVISSLPARLKETLQSSRVPSLRGRYPTSLLLRTRPPPSRLRSTSLFNRLYHLPCSGDFAPGREGFTSHSMCPCHRAVAFTPPRWKCRIGQISAPHAAFALRKRARPSDLAFRGHICVHCRYGPVTRGLPHGR